MGAGIHFSTAMTCIDHISLVLMVAVIIAMTLLLIRFASQINTIYKKASRDGGPPKQHVSAVDVVRTQMFSPTVSRRLSEPRSDHMWVKEEY
ncbi:hypothetical protein YALI2_E01265g [Yarrowia lipolytica]|nr:hypothetical protein YALI2_E01265g [Yarrowia lipolytica]